MTREEAFKEHREIDKNNKWFNYDLQLLGLIEKIYDDFESRTCENCHYYTGKVCYYHEGWNDEVGVVHPSMDKDDGCLKFERKENE